MKTALLIGATGLIGAYLLESLLNDNDYKEVKVLARRKLSIHHPKLNALVINFDEIENHKDFIQADDLFCCIGSTVKKTPNLDQYYKIDYSYPLEIARIAKQNGAFQFHLVSAMGANSSSKIFYLRTKGELERDLQKVGFDSLFIYRPGLLDGNRLEERKRENILIGMMRWINSLLIGPLKKYRSIKFEMVADAMLLNAQDAISGLHILESEEIKKIVLERTKKN